MADLRESDISNTSTNLLRLLVILVCTAAKWLRQTRLTIRLPTIKFQVLCFELVSRRSRKLLPTKKCLRCIITQILKTVLFLIKKKEKQGKGDYHDKLHKPVLNMNSRSLSTERKHLAI